MTRHGTIKNEIRNLERGIHGFLPNVFASLQSNRLVVRLRNTDDEGIAALLDVSLCFTLSQALIFRTPCSVHVRIDDLSTVCGSIRTTVGFT